VIGRGEDVKKEEKMHIDTHSLTHTHIHTHSIKLALGKWQQQFVGPALDLDLLIFGSDGA